MTTRHPATLRVPLPFTTTTATAVVSEDPGLEPNIMRQVALGMADGQLAQADYYLLVHEGRAPRPADAMKRTPPLVQALLHMRSGCKWLVSAAEAT